MKGQTSEFVQARKPQRALRANMTVAEQKLWQRLRGKQLGVKFRRQHPFGNYILDFVCLPQGLIVELDGGQHAEQVLYDSERTAQLEAAGFRVLRFWNNQVMNELDSVVESIQRAIQTHPHPSLPPEGEGVAFPHLQGEG
jgi:very-short-patch-repair endonuclease